jgi:hypothetical protein
LGELSTSRAAIATIRAWAAPKTLRPVTVLFADTVGSTALGALTSPTSSFMLGVRRRHDAESGGSGSRDERLLSQRLCAFLAACVVALGGAAAAEAGAVSVTLASPSNGTLSFQAAPGEANHVTIEMTSDLATWLVTDTGAPLTAGQGCTSTGAESASCAAPLPDPVRLSVVHGVDIARGDMEDWASVATACFYRERELHPFAAIAVRRSTAGRAATP